MSVDVTTRIEIARPRAQVAAYAVDPDIATAWYRNIDAGEWITREPAGFAKVAAPVPARAMERANRADLRRLNEIIESS